MISSERIEAIGMGVGFACAGMGMLLAVVLLALRLFRVI